jgi:hypothetical protein
VFLGYSNQHKGYKCLEPSSGRVYISHDVIFDETVFPFSTLHPNVGAHLKAEILLLHPTLCNIHGGERVEEPNVTNVADTTVESLAEHELQVQRMAQPVDKFPDLSLQHMITTVNNLIQLP